jgi:hypothetical protein
VAALEARSPRGERASARERERERERERDGRLDGEELRSVRYAPVGSWNISELSILLLVVESSERVES